MLFSVPDLLNLSGYDVAHSTYVCVMDTQIISRESESELCVPQFYLQAALKSS
jgi:hypothetical protein